jgi:alkylation response protein AidB-like acyl-CoA dehydrogenase
MWTANQARAGVGYRGTVTASDHPLVAAARALAADLLEPAAAEVDVSGVPRSHLDAIAKAGLLGLLASPGVGAHVVRAVAEALAGADAATWFVQAQHHSPVRMLADNPSPASERYLAKLARGELIAGIAFSHLRRFPARPVTATRQDGGWRLDGAAPWYSGWGLNDVAFVAGVTDDGEVVFGVVPAREGNGLTVRATLRTAALDAARTVALGLDGVFVDDVDVALVAPHARWLAADTAASSNANPAIFGIGRSALRLLRETAARRGEPAAEHAAKALEARLDDARARAYALADEEPRPPVIAARLAARAGALETLIACTTALVAANSGPAMAISSAPQRKAREALFMLVQAQTLAGRTATLERFAG